MPIYKELDSHDTKDNTASDHTGVRSLGSWMSTSMEMAKLTNVEFTTTTLCKYAMRALRRRVHAPAERPECAVDLLLKRLDEIPLLRSISITGGEPMLSKSVKEYVVRF